MSVSNLFHSTNTDEKKLKINKIEIWKELRKKLTDFL